MTAFQAGFARTVSRGPDDSRVIDVGQGILGFHRLSIMGLHPEGMQPFGLNGSWVVCNGEIYGFEKLKQALSKDYTFTSESDCEVLLPYEQVAGILDDAYVATDDERIEKAVKAFGGKVMMTSVHHKSGTDRCYEACVKIGGDFDVVVNIQGDEPFIQPSQLNAVKACFEDPTTQIATLVKPFTADEPFAVLENVNSPKVVVNANWNALYFSRSIIPYQRNAEKKDWLKGHTYYKHIGLYAYRTEVLREITALPQSSLEIAESLEQLRWLENGYKIKVGISEVETIGIDTPQDLARAEEFLKNRL